jgi:hypothetical protein
LSEEWNCRFLRSPRRRFEVEEEPLALQPARVAGELAVPADDPVAGDDHGERVVADGIADLARQGGVSELACELAVGSRLSVLGIDLADGRPRMGPVALLRDPSSLGGRSLTTDQLVSR